MAHKFHVIESLYYPFYSKKQAKNSIKIIVLSFFYFCILFAFGWSIGWSVGLVVVCVVLLQLSLFICYYHNNISYRFFLSWWLCLLAEMLSVFIIDHIKCFFPHFSMWFDNLFWLKAQVFNICTICSLCVALCVLVINSVPGLLWSFTSDNLIYMAWSKSRKCAAFIYHCLNKAQTGWLTDSLILCNYILMVINGMTKMPCRIELAPFAIENHWNSMIALNENTARQNFFNNHDKHGLFI